MIQLYHICYKYLFGSGSLNLLVMLRRKERDNIYSSECMRVVDQWHMLPQSPEHVISNPYLIPFAANVKDGLV